MTKGEPHIDYRQFDTIKIGNAMAQRIITKGPRPNYSATLRHALTRNGTEHAVALACDLLSLDHKDACTVIARLSTSKPDDVWSPHDRDSEWQRRYINVSKMYRSFVIRWLIAEWPMI